MKLYEYLKKFLSEETESKRSNNDEDIKGKFDKLFNDIKEKRKVINFIKPKLDIELEEIERTKQDLNLTNDQFEKIKEKFETEKLTILNYKEIDNSDYNAIESFDDFIKLIKKYGKDVNRLLNKFNEGEVEAPIILSIGNKNPYLIGGNTRLMILKLMLLESLNVKPKVLEIKI